MIPRNKQSPARVSGQPRSISFWNSDCVLPSSPLPQKSFPVSLQMPEGVGVGWGKKDAAKSTAPMEQGAYSPLTALAMEKGAPAFITFPSAPAQGEASSSPLPHSRWFTWLQGMAGEREWASSAGPTPEPPEAGRHLSGRLWGWVREVEG